MDEESLRTWADQILTVVMLPVASVGVVCFWHSLAVAQDAACAGSESCAMGYVVGYAMPLLGLGVLDGTVKSWIGADSYRRYLRERRRNKDQALEPFPVEDR